MGSCSKSCENVSTFVSSWGAIAFEIHSFSHGVSKALSPSFFGAPQAEEQRKHQELVEQKRQEIERPEGLGACWVYRLSGL